MVSTYAPTILLSENHHKFSTFRRLPLRRKHVKKKGYLISSASSENGKNEI